MKETLIELDTRSTETVSIPSPYGTFKVELPTPSEGIKVRFAVGEDGFNVRWPTTPKQEET